MSKLIVLSDTNNLSYLKKHGIHPSRFYTDLSLFEIHSPYFQNVKVCVIISSSSLFSASKLEDIMKNLISRAESASDKQVIDVILLSDHLLKDATYFHYKQNLGTFDLYKGMKKLESGVRLWSWFTFEKCEDTEVYLSDLHSGNVKKFSDSYMDSVGRKKSKLEEVIKRAELL